MAAVVEGEETPPAAPPAPPSHSRASRMIDALRRLFSHQDSPFAEHGGGGSSSSPSSGRGAPPTHEALHAELVRVERLLLQVQSQAAGLCEILLEEGEPSADEGGRNLFSRFCLLRRLSPL